MSAWVDLTSFVTDVAMTATGTTTTSTIDTGFLSKIKSLWCDLMGKSGPLVPVVAGAAVAVFAVLFVLDEGKGYMSTALRILLGIAILVFIPALLKAAFGIDMGCS